MINSHRTGFATKLGGVLAAAGSAVGLGNIWRFPMEAGQNGGGAFILIYLACVLCFGLPIMIAEFVVGRHARANVGSAYDILAPGTKWKYVGPWAVLIAFLIICYYNVVAGWVLCYFYDALAGNFIQIAEQVVNGDPSAYVSNFNNFVTDPWKPVVCLLGTIGITHFVITKGVRSGIENSSRIFMPALFIILILLMIFAFNMPGAKQGIEFILKPNFDNVHPSTVLAALSQCFYSMSLGMGIVTYASYFRREANLSRNAISVAFMDTMVAIIAGPIIFPAVFSVPGVEPQAGASLVFIALPNVFGNALSSSPLLMWFVPVLFYALLLLASLTSVIFLHEVVTAWVAETFSFTRHRSAKIVTSLVILLGILCSLSMGILSNFTVAGLNLFDLLDTVTTKIMLPISGIMVCLFVGWKLSTRKLWVELTSHMTVTFKPIHIFVGLLRFVCPALIFVILVSGFMD